MKQLDPTETIAIGFQVHYTLDEGRAISFSSCIDSECSPADLSAALDKIVDAAERQQARVKLPKLRVDLADLQARHKNAAEDMFRLDAEGEMTQASWQARHVADGRRGAYKPSPAQHSAEQKRLADRTNAEITFKRYDEVIAQRQQEIASLEGMLNAIPSSADSNAGVSNS